MAGVYVAIVGKVVTWEEEKQMSQSEVVEEETMRWVWVTESLLGCRDTLNFDIFVVRCMVVYKFSVVF